MCHTNMSTITKEQVKKELCAMVDKAMDIKNVEVCLYVFIECVLICFDVIRAVDCPWSSRLWIQPLIYHREAQLVYYYCCGVIYWCVS